MGRGVGQGGTDVSKLQDYGSVACGGGDKFLARPRAGAGQDGGC